MTNRSVDEWATNFAARRLSVAVALAAAGERQALIASHDPDVVAGALLAHAQMFDALSSHPAAKTSVMTVLRKYKKQLNM